MKLIRIGKTSQAKVFRKEKWIGYYEVLYIGPKS